jgi:hypothetical protein
MAHQLPLIAAKNPSGDGAVQIQAERAATTRNCGEVARVLGQGSLRSPPGQRHNYSDPDTEARAPLHYQTTMAARPEHAAAAAAMVFHEVRARIGRGVSRGMNGSREPTLLSPGVQVGKRGRGRPCSRQWRRLPRPPLRRKGEVLTRGPGIPVTVARAYGFRLR